MQMLLIYLLNTNMYRSGPEVIKIMLNSAEHENFPAHKCENAILTFMSGKNSVLGSYEPEKC